MQLFDNVRMAFGSLWANKMQALLTMLGIIIGIGSVIAIVTLGDSLTGSITDSLQSFGVNNISVSLQQKATTTPKRRAGAWWRCACSARPSRTKADLITDAMIEEFRALRRRYLCHLAEPEPGQRHVKPGQYQRERDRQGAQRRPGPSQRPSYARALYQGLGRRAPGGGGERQVFARACSGSSSASVLGRSLGWR